MNDVIIRNIHQRMLGVMDEIAFVNKDKKNTFMKFDYVSHDNVTASIRPYLIKHGINVTFDVVDHTVQELPDGKGLMTCITAMISFVNADQPTDRIDVRSIGQGIDKNDLGPGKAMSYAYKYALLKAFALETGLDNEATAGNPGGNGKNAVPAKPTVTPPSQPRYINTFPPHVQEMVDGVRPDTVPAGNTGTPTLKQQFMEIVNRTFPQANQELARIGFPPLTNPEEYAEILGGFVGELNPNLIRGLQTRPYDAIRKMAEWLKGPDEKFKEWAKKQKNGGGK